MLSWLGPDIRQGLRRVRHAPGFSAVVMLTLALGVGASTALFSAVNAVLLKPLPFPDDEQLVMLNDQNPDKSQPRFGASWPDFRDWREQTHSFSGMSLFVPGSMVIQGADGPDRVGGLFVERNFLELLGVKPAIGRLFGPEDEHGESSNSIVLGYGYWQEHFGGDRGALGRTIEVNGRPRVIIGVLSPDASVLGPVFVGERLGAVTVIDLTSYPRVENHAQHLFAAIGRMKPGVTLAQAQQDLYTTEERIALANPVIAGWTANVFRLRDELSLTTGQPLVILLAAAGLVLLIGCINVANLLLARGAMRARELSLRQAIGASRGRIVTQLLVESTVLSIGGGLLGVGMASASLGTLRRLIPAGLIARVDDIALDARVVLLALALCLITALAAGLWPAVRASIPALAQTLRSGGRGSTGGPASQRARRGLVVAEVALALMLLVSAGLVVKSLDRLTRVDPGFRPDHVITANLSLGGKYIDTAQVPLYRTLLTDLAGRPGIEAAGATDTPPLVGGGFFTSIRLIGEPPRPQGQPLMSTIVAVTPGYFKAIGQTVMQGRDLSWADGEPKILLSETAARTYWPRESAVGHRIGMGADSIGHEIVGVVRDTRRLSLATPPGPVVYVSIGRYARVIRSVALVIRSKTDAASTIALTRAAVRAADPTLPLFTIQTMQEIVDQSLAQQKLEATLLTLFGAAALVLATLGMYAVISYSVTTRQQELGVRIALGATRRNVLALVLSEGTALAGAGIAVGVAGALGATRLLQGWLFGVGRTDLATFAAAAALLLLIALAASYGPARRATRVDPLDVMRGD